MERRDLVPATNKNPPLATESLPSGAKTPALGGGLSSAQNPMVDHRVQNPVMDHRAHSPVAGHTFRPGYDTMRPSHETLRPTHELDHGSAIKPLRSGQLGRGHAGERGFFSSDETALNKQIQATHAPDMEELNMRPILAIIEDILRLARPQTDDHITTPGAAAATSTALVNFFIPSTFII